MKWSYLFIIPLPFLSFWLGYGIVQLIHAPRVIKAPSLIGLSATQACLTAGQHNLAIRIARTVQDNTLVDGTVIDQVPAPLQAIKVHQPLLITITQQSPPAQAPRYIDRTLPEIRAHAQQNNMPLHEHFLESSYPQEVCFAQIPAPNASVYDPPVIVYISASKKEWYILPNYRGCTVAEVKEHVPDTVATLTITHTIPVDKKHICTTCIVTDQRPLPGSVIATSQQHRIALSVTPL